MSEAGRVKIYYAEEATYAASVAAGAMNTLAYPLSETFKPVFSHTTTAALRGDFVNPLIIRNKRASQGGFGFELAYGDPDNLLEGVLRNDWTAAVSISATDISADTTDDSFNRAAGSFVTDGVLVGMWIKVSGWTTTGTGNNGYWRVLTVAALKITVDGNLATKIAGDTVVITNSGMLRNGTTGKSFAFERNFSDLSAKWLRQVGVRLGGVNMEWTTDNPVRGAFTDFVGRRMTSETASAGSGSFNAAVTTRVMNGIDEVFAISEGGTATALNVSRLSFDFKGGLEALHALGSADPFNVGQNSFMLTGNFMVYLEDAAFALASKALDNTASKLWWRATDAAGNTYIFTIPALRYTDVTDLNAAGNDNRLYAGLPWQAELDSVTGCIFQIDRIAA